MCIAARCYHPASLEVATGAMVSEQPPAAAKKLARIGSKSSSTDALRVVVMGKAILVTPPLRLLESALRTAIEEAIRVVRERVQDEIDLITTPTSLPGSSYIDQLRNQIKNVDVLMADLSSPWPSVLVDVGYAEALRKPVLLLAQNLDEVPAPSSDRRVLLYSGPSSPHVQPRLEEALYSILSTHHEMPSAQLGEPSRNVARAFISYSHADTEYLDRILVHLRPLERAQLIDSWSDRRIRPGQDWRVAIGDALKGAKVAILLVSADFLASEFVASNELPNVLAEAEKKQGTRIIPVILKPSRFERESALSRFQALNSPKLPVIRMTEAEREELYARLAAEIETDLKFSVVAQ
jgi:hypothetical protein